MHAYAEYLSLPEEKQSYLRLAVCISENVHGVPYFFHHRKRSFLTTENEFSYQPVFWVKCNTLPRLLDFRPQKSWGWVLGASLGDSSAP